MNSPLRTLIPVATLLFAVASPASAQTVEIKPHWQVGKKISQTMNMDQTSTMALGDQKMEQKVAVTMDTSMSVRAHENGKGKRVTVKYDRVAMDMNMMGQAMKYDSAKPADAAADPLGVGKSLGVFVGKEIKLVLDEKDEVQEVENLDAIMKEMAAANPMASMFGQMFSKDAMKNMMRQSALYGSPGKPVKTGDAWPFVFSIPMPPLGKVSMDGTYTVKSQGERGGAKCTELALAGKLAIEPLPAGATADPATASLQAMGLTATGGTLTGTLWFDPVLGICREATMNQEINLKMKNPQKPDESMEIPMKQVIKQTVTKVEDIK